MIDSEMKAWMDRVESRLDALVTRQAVKEFYTTAEFAELVGKSDLTIREHCRFGRIKAEKKQSGRGAHPAWVIAHAELLRYQRDGLMPLTRTPR